MPFLNARDRTGQFYIICHNKTAYTGNTPIYQLNIIDVASGRNIALYFIIYRNIVRQLHIGFAFKHTDAIGNRGLFDFDIKRQLYAI